MKNNVLSSRIISASVIAAMSAGMLAGCGSSAVKCHFLSGANGRLKSVAFESNGILYSQAAGC
jgi:hypothetical protein